MLWHWRRLQCLSSTRLGQLPAVPFSLDKAREFRPISSSAPCAHPSQVLSSESSESCGDTSAAVATSVSPPCDLTSMPSPHPAEQFDQLDHGSWSQVEMQAPELQGWDSETAPQASPPCFGCWSTVRARPRTPPEHGREQTDHSDHVETWHGTEHFT